MDLDKDPTLRYDSWFTIGAEDNYMNSVTPFIVVFDEFERAMPSEQKMGRGLSHRTSGRRWQLRKRDSVDAAHFNR